MSEYQVPSAELTRHSRSFGSVSVQALDRILALKLGDFVGATAGVENRETQKYTLKTDNCMETRGVTALDKVFAVDGILSTLFQGDRCKKSWMKNNKAVVCFVANNVSGDLDILERQKARKKLFEDRGVDVDCAQVAARAATGATDSSRDTVQNDSTNPASVFAVTVNYFKVALIDGQFFSKGPVDCQGIDCHRTREVATWVQVGDLNKRQRLGLGEETREGVAGMTAMANYITAPPFQTHTWGEHTEKAVWPLSATVGAVLDPDTKIASAAFTVSNENGTANYDTACNKVHHFVANHKEGTNAADGQVRQGSLHGSVIVILGILGYDKDTLSSLFQLVRWTLEMVGIWRECALLLSLT
jgi:hypothetical protein